MKAFFAFLLLAACSVSYAASYSTTRVASGLTRPVFVTYAPGDPTRLFVVEQRVNVSGVNTGRIRIITQPENTLLATPFLSIPGVTSGGEQGLLGLAFHPDYQTNGYFYVNYTDTSGTTRIVRYKVSADPNVADAASAFNVLSVNQPYDNHNGGWIGFGPDGYLYIALGDGGSANDPLNHAQNIESLLGKILRIIPPTAANPAPAYTVPAGNPFVSVAGRDEIWAYGLRNPWRNSFDRATGDLYIADVGQGNMEEVSFQPAVNGGGRNYGWRCMEGTLCTGLSGCTCNSSGLVLPIHEYSHDFGCSITGGYVYRGSLVPELTGQYFFADYCSNTIWSFAYSNGQKGTVTDQTGDLDPIGALSISGIVSFGEDFYGEMYICDLFGGEVFKIVPTTLNGAKAQANGSSIVVKGASISRAFPDYYYIQSDDRSMGIRVNQPGHTLTAGRIVDVAGKINTSADGERYIQADTTTSVTGQAVVPVNLNNKTLGGEATSDYDAVSGKGQAGTVGSTGLNNVGLLVKTWGKVISSSGQTFVIDDGSNVPVRVVASSGVTVPSTGSFVTVTGPVSTYLDSGEIKARILARNQSDITVE